MGHVPRAVDLALVVDTLYDLYTGLWGKCVSTQLAALIVVVAPVKTIGGGTIITLGEVNGGNLEVVLGLPRRVRAKKDTVYSVRLVRGSGNSSIDGRMRD